MKMKMLVSQFLTTPAGEYHPVRLEEDACGDLQELQAEHNAHIAHIIAERGYVHSNFRGMLQRATAAGADIRDVGDPDEVERRLVAAQVPDDVLAFFSRVLTLLRLGEKLDELEEDIKQLKKQKRAKQLEALGLNSFCGLFSGRRVQAY